MYLLGFTGDVKILISISNALVEIFGDLPIESLEKVFKEFKSGERGVVFNINISHISKALIDNGLETLKMIEDKKVREKFYGG